MLVADPFAVRKHPSASLIVIRNSVTHRRRPGPHEHYQQTP